jgi:hypothetical protein
MPRNESLYPALTGFCMFDLGHERHKKKALKGSRTL